MANHESMIDLERHKRELQEVEVSKSDKLEPERLLSANEMTRCRGGGTGWIVVRCCPQFSFDFPESCRRQNVATTKDMLKSIECMLKIRSLPKNLPRFMGVHDATHANVEWRDVTTGPGDPGSSPNCDRTRSASVNSELEQQEDQREWCAAVLEQLDEMRTLWSQMMTAVFVFGRLQGCFAETTSVIGDRLQQSVRRDSQKGAAPSSTD